jgi:hypothetical protein
MNIDAPSAVIVIDTVSDNSYIVKSLHEKIIEFCQKHSVKLIVLSDWYNAVQSLKKQRVVVSDLDLPLLKFTNGWKSTNKIISEIDNLDYHELVSWWNNKNISSFFSDTDKLTSLDSMPLTSNQVLVNGWTILQLQYLFNVKFREIENVYFFGGAWNDCLHSRSIGITAFYRAIKNNFFETNKRVLTKLDCVFSRAGYHNNRFKDNIPSDYTLEDLNKMRTIVPGPEWYYHEEHNTYELVSFPLVRARDQKKLATQSNLFTEAQAKETKSSS